MGLHRGLSGVYLGYAMTCRNAHCRYPTQCNGVTCVRWYHTDNSVSPHYATLCALNTLCDLLVIDLDLVSAAQILPAVQAKVAHSVTLDPTFPHWCGMNLDYVLAPTLWEE